MAEYVLHIDLSGSGETTKLKNASDKLQQSLGQDPNSSKQKSKQLQNALDKLNKYKKAIAAKAVTEIASASKTVYNNIAASYSSRYGDTARTNTMNNISNYAGTVINTANSAVSGYATAVTFGASGPVGAVIAMALQAVTETINSINRGNDWQANQYKNTLNEIRSSERIGMMQTDRNR